MLEVSLLVLLSIIAGSFCIGGAIGYVIGLIVGAVKIAKGVMNGVEEHLNKGAK